MSVVPPAYENGPKLSVFFVTDTERGKPVCSSRFLIRTGETVRHSVGHAGKRIRRKRMPGCNGRDRVLKGKIEYFSLFDPTRKGADFRMVSDCKRI